MYRQEVVSDFSDEDGLFSLKYVPPNISPTHPLSCFHFSIIAVVGHAEKQ